MFDNVNPFRVFPLFFSQLSFSLSSALHCVHAPIMIMRVTSTHCVAQVGCTENVSSPHHSSETADYTQTTGEQPAELSVEQKDETEANKQQAASAREYAVKLEDEFPKTCDDIFKLVDKNLVLLASAGESRTIYCKTEGGVEAALESAVMNSEKVPGTDRTSVLSIPPDGDQYASQTREIAGVLKELTDETTADVNALQEEGQNTVEVPQAKYTDRTVDMSVADVPVVLQRQVPAILQTLGVPQVQYVDEISDVPVVAQRRVPTIQAAQKTEEVPQVQFPDRAPDVPVSMQRQVPQEQILERVVEEIDVSVPSVREEIIEVADYVSQERIVEETIDVSVPHVTEKIVEVGKHIQQEQVHGHVVEHAVYVPVPRVTEEILEVAKHVPRERVPNYTVEHLVDVTAPWIRRGTGRVIQGTPQDRISG